MNIAEYVALKNKQEVIFNGRRLGEDDIEDFETHITDKIFCAIAETLPLNPPEPIGFDLWSDGVQILCRTEELAERLADMIEAITGEGPVVTGYYDPFEDARDGSTDDHTGWWYVDFD